MFRRRLVAVRNAGGTRWGGQAAVQPGGVQFGNTVASIQQAGSDPNNPAIVWSAWVTPHDTWLFTKRQRDASGGGDA